VIFLITLFFSLFFFLFFLLSSLFFSPSLYPLLISYCLYIIYDTGIISEINPNPALLILVTLVMILLRTVCNSKWYYRYQYGKLKYRNIWLLVILVYIDTSILVRNAPTRCLIIDKVATLCMYVYQVFDTTRFNQR
jgi:hypothetical protein